MGAAQRRPAQTRAVAMEKKLAEQKLCLDALAIALGDNGDGQLWFVPTRNLQMVCVDLCQASRTLPTWSVVVTPNAPGNVWPRADQGYSLREPVCSRIPPMSVSAVRWEMTTACISKGIEVMKTKPLGASPMARHLRQVTFGNWFNIPLGNIVGLTSLRSVTFGIWFNQPITQVVWPASLQQLTFGRDFNQPIDKVIWPASLQQIAFGFYFNQPIDGITWPSSLRALAFGYKFNQAIDKVVWPGCLRNMAFDGDFDQPIDGVTWPSLLQTLMVGRSFNQLVDHIVWPESMRQMKVV